MSFLNENNDECDLKKLITCDAILNNSLLVINAIDLSAYKVFYANEHMSEIMFDTSAKNCWEAIHGQEEKCHWCRVDEILKKTEKNRNATYEYFNEVANRWYQLQDKIVTIEDGRDILVSFGIDITMQKEYQSNLITAHVKLTQQKQSLQKIQKQLENHANQDPLTGMYNRRYFHSFSKKLIALGERNNTPLSILMIDIDKFKTINDNYGHDIGDEAIKFLAHQIINSTRQSDLSARFGGEEFVIMLPDANLKNSVKFANRFRKKIEKSIVTNIEKNISFTVSIGVAQIDYKEENALHQAFLRMDKALYHSKENGRNQVNYL